EYDGVEPLRVLAGLHRSRVRKDVTAMIALHYADMAADVAWQPRVGRRVNVFRAHAIAGLEFRGGGSLAAELAAHHHALDINQRELAVLEQLWRLRRVPGSHFLGGDITLVDQQILETEKPFLVVGAGEIN